MSPPSPSRRDFMRQSAAAAAASAAGITLPGAAQNVNMDTESSSLRWSKAPCRFCGTGCSVLVGTQNGRVVATQGDPESEVNRGLHCVKGYFLSKIMYGADRLTTPLLRKKNGVYDKNGAFTPVSWSEAFDVMAAKWKEALKTGGPTSVGMFGLLGVRSGGGDVEVPIRRPGSSRTNDSSSRIEVAEDQRSVLSNARHRATSASTLDGTPGSTQASERA